MQGPNSYPGFKANFWVSKPISGCQGLFSKQTQVSCKDAFLYVTAKSAHLLSVSLLLDLKHQCKVRVAKFKFNCLPRRRPSASWPRETRAILNVGENREKIVRHPKLVTVPKVALVLDNLRSQSSLYEWPEWTCFLHTIFSS